MAITDSLLKTISHSSIMLMSLHGVRTAFERELELRNMVIATSDSVKRELLRKGSTAYPYSYLSISELIGLRDQNSNKHIQRHGIRMGAEGATRATSRKAYLFPINIGMELKYLDSDPTRTFLMAESMVILSMLGGLQFELLIGESIRFLVRVEIPETTAIPIGSYGSTESPEASELTLSLVIHTYAGFMRDVSAVNSGRPILSVSIVMDNDDTPIEVRT